MQCTCMYVCIAIRQATHFRMQIAPAVLQTAVGATAYCVDYKSACGCVISDMIPSEAISTRRAFHVHLPPVPYIRCQKDRWPTPLKEPIRTFSAKKYCR
jgi:hypothetical protein